ncbi:MAG: protein kinase [bacterium]|nr:protein kinase [bacterium]
MGNVPDAEIKTLLVSDLKDSTRLVEQVGDGRMADVWHRHDRLARDLMRDHEGQEADRTDGFLVLFDRPINAVRYALAFHQAMRILSEEVAIDLGFRVGIHLGEAVLIVTPAADVAGGAKPLEVEGLAKQIAARIMSLALAGQTLLTRAAFMLARRAAVGDEGLQWLAHGRYLLKGVTEPLEVYEVGREGLSPLAPPPGSEKIKPVVGREMSAMLAEAYRRKELLANAGQSTRAVEEEILSLRREIRRGRQLRPGDMLHGDRFLLIEQIGSGGYAIVWKAVDLKSGGDVAVKVLRGDRAQDPRASERFSRGARKMAELQHPGVVRVVETALEDDGWQFFVMAWAEGGDFRQAVLGQRIPIDERLRIVLAIGKVLEYAHTAAVIHRDVKPANILLDGNNQPLLTDFDLVWAADTTGGTRTAGMLGTFLYAAPEALDNPKEAGVAADVYSLGMTAIFAICGRDLPTRVIRDAKRFIAELKCSEAVKPVLLKAVAWEARERFASVGAFCAQLRRVLEHDGEPNRPDVVPIATPQ